MQGPGKRLLASSAGIQPRCHTLRVLKLRHGWNMNPSDEHRRHSNSHELDEQMMHSCIHQGPYPSQFPLKVLG